MKAWRFTELADRTQLFVTPAQFDGLQRVAFINPDTAGRLDAERTILYHWIEPAVCETLIRKRLPVELVVEDPDVSGGGPEPADSANNTELE